MPDIHQGYGFPIGGVVATKLPEGAISPVASVTGVRLLAAHITMEEVRPLLEELAFALYRNCLSGMGTKGNFPLSESELLHEGARWALKEGLAGRSSWLLSSAGDVGSSHPEHEIREHEAATVSDAVQTP